MTVVAMTRNEFSRLEIVMAIEDGQMTADQAAEHLRLSHEGRDLPYRIFDKLQKVDQAATVENKRLGAVLPTSRSGKRNSVGDDLRKLRANADKRSGTFSRPRNSSGRHADRNQEIRYGDFRPKIQGF
jgi:hypothetical protein